MEPAIQLRDVVAVLGGFPALAGADLAVARGEVVALHGPNGAGKTSLLRLCAGLLPVTSGEASVLGHDLTGDPRPVRRRCGLLADGGGLYDELTVADNVAFWARAAGAESRDAQAAAERMGVSGRLAGVRVAQLSTGQRRRTALACLLARRAELWLLDEPHAGLDADGRDLLDELIASGSGAGVTVLIASHEHDRVAALDCRSVEVNGGILSEGDGSAA